MSILLFYARTIFLLYATLEFHLKDKIKPEFFHAFFFATAKVASITAMIFFHVIGLCLLKSGGCLYSRHISLAGQTYACFVFRDVLYG